MTTKRNLALGLSLAVALSLLVAPLKALAAVWTDLPDYAPGSVVTISGDNSDGAGYLAGETVYVDVNGPNGYTRFNLPSAATSTADIIIKVNNC